MKRDKIVNNLTERLCSNAKPAVLIVDVFCLPAKLLPGRYNLYGNSLEIQVKYTIEKNVFVMFLRFIDHCIRLFPIVANHRSSDAMFVLYRSSLMSRFLSDDFVQHSYHIIIDYEEGRPSIIRATRWPPKVCSTLKLVHLTMLTSSLNNIFGPKFSHLPALGFRSGRCLGFHTQIFS